MGLNCLKRMNDYLQGLGELMYLMSGKHEIHSPFLGEVKGVFISVCEKNLYEKEVKELIKARFDKILGKYL